MGGFVLKVVNKIMCGLIEFHVKRIAQQQFLNKYIDKLCFNRLDYFFTFMSIC